MSRLKAFIFFCFCFLFTLFFYNCAPLTEQGNFKETDINVFNSENPGTTRTEGDGDTKDESDDEDDEESDSTEEDDEDDEDDEDEDDEPVGDEFDGSETPESGGTPITRDLY